MMSWHYTPYILPAFITAMISATLTFYVWQRRSTPGAVPLTVLLVAVAEWSLAYALELGGTNLTTKIFWAKVQYVGIIMVPVTWLAFVLHYTARTTWLRRRNLALLMIVPLVTLLLVWTNSIHGLIWSYTGLDTSGSFLALDVTYGTWFWLHTAYAYLLWSVGTILLIPMLLRQVGVYREQVGIILAGAFFPFLGNVLYVSGLSPFPQLDLTPFAFVSSAFAAVWALLRFPLLDVMPVTRRAVVDSSSDVIIVLDTQHRVVDLNPAAQPFITLPTQEPLGQPVGQVFADHTNLVKICNDVPEANNEITLRIGEAQHCYDVRITPLNDQSARLIGWSVVLRDITERKQAAEALRESEAKQRALLNAIPDMMFRIDGEGTFLDFKAGKGLESLLIRSDVLDKKVSEVMPREIAQQTMHYVERALQSGDIQIFEHRSPTKDDPRDYEVRLVASGVQADEVLAIVRDITERKARESVLEEERARIARDLHDGLAQDLYFLGLKFDYLRTQVKRAPESIISELEALKKTVQANIDDVRRTIFALRPVDLDGLGFGQAVRQYVREFGKQMDLEIELNLPDDDEALPAALEPVFFRLVQEGLNNIAKHAQADHAWIEFVIENGQTGRLTIRDDGLGFDPQILSLSSGAKLGLRQMRERVTTLGGHFSVESWPGQGVTLRAEIPL